MKYDITTNLAELTDKLNVLLTKKDVLDKQLDPIVAEITTITNRIKKIRQKESLPAIKQAIDNIFNNSENKDCNIIILNGVHGDFDGSRDLYEREDWEEYDSVTVSLHEGYGTRYNKWASAVNYSETNEKLLNQFYEVFHEIPSSKDYYGDDSGVNCYWHGIVALSKDYKIVGFICRDDNMMLNEYKDCPDVLIDFNTWNDD